MRTGKAIGIGALGACAAVGFAAAIVLASVAGAGNSAPAQTTEPPPTTPPPTVPVPPPSPRELRIAQGVTIGEVYVGGLLPEEASAVVRQEYAKPLVLVASPKRQFLVRPWSLGAEPFLRKAVTRARFAKPDTEIPLNVGVSRDRVRAYLKSVRRQLVKAPVNARLYLSGATVRAAPSREGRTLPILVNARTIRKALATNSRQPIQLKLGVLKPRITEDNLGAAIVIMRDSKRLRYFDDAKLRRTFGVATGQSSFPTPLGSYEIVTMQQNPWWYPPPSPWAEDADPVPPGPGNPLGTRWMGISAPYVGIHGTPDAASIGYSASHGCVRMLISEAEWLFNHVEVGTPVFIVSH
jgi:lipoprotein-anchoring transpeptidase ErfK/SrfK